MVEPIIPADRCVVDILEDIRVDRDTIAAVERLKRAGYRIALDDFQYSDEYIPLLQIADFVKLDARALTRAQAEDHVSILKRYGAQIIAEKIESESELLAWASLGCNLFQGYYLRRPEILDGRRLDCRHQHARRGVDLWPSAPRQLSALPAEYGNPDAAAGSRSVRGRCRIPLGVASGFGGARQLPARLSRVCASAGPYV